MFKSLVLGLVMVLVLGCNARVSVSSHPSSPADLDQDHDQVRKAYVQAVMQYYTKAEMSCWGADETTPGSGNYVLFIKFPDFSATDDPTGWNIVYGWALHRLVNGTAVYQPNDDISFVPVNPTVAGLICATRGETP